MSLLTITLGLEPYRRAIPKPVEPIKGRQRKTKPAPSISTPKEPDWQSIVSDLVQAGYRRKTISKMDGMDIHEHTLNALLNGKSVKVPWMAGQILLKLHSQL